jgi:hypothetical protein
MSDGPSVAVPDEVSVRLQQWRGLWIRSAGYHYFFGIAGVTASSLAAIDFGEGYQWLSKLLPTIAALCLAVLGFVHPDRRYQKFVRAWRALDPVVLKYKYGRATLDDVFAAIERGESIITEYEQEIAPRQVPRQAGNAATEGFTS